MLNRRFRRSSQRAKPKSFKNSFLIAVFETCFILCSTPSRFVKTKPPFWSEKAEDVESCTRTVHLFVGRNRLFHAILHFRRSFLVSRKELSYSVISLTNSDNEDDYKSCFLFCNGFFADVISRLSFLLSFPGFLPLSHPRASIARPGDLWIFGSHAQHDASTWMSGSRPNMTGKKPRMTEEKIILSFLCLARESKRDIRVKPEYDKEKEAEHDKEKKPFRKRGLWFSRLRTPQHRSKKDFGLAFDYCYHSLCRKTMPHKCYWSYLSNTQHYVQNQKYFSDKPYPFVRVSVIPR